MQFRLIENAFYQRFERRIRKIPQFKSKHSGYRSRKVTQIIKNRGVNENDWLLRTIFFPFTTIASNVRLPCRGDTQLSSANMAWCEAPGTLQKHNHCGRCTNITHSNNFVDALFQKQRGSACSNYSSFIRGLHHSQRMTTTLCETLSRP